MIRRDKIMQNMKNGAILRTAVLFSSLIFILIGVLRKEHMEVMKKAVNICLECIGVG